VTDPHWQRRQAYPTEGWDGDSATAGYGVTLLAGSESAYSGPHDDGGPPRAGPNELCAREPKEAFRQRQKSYEHGNGAQEPHQDRYAFGPKSGSLTASP